VHNARTMGCLSAFGVRVRQAPLSFAATYRVSVWADAARTRLIERREGKFFVAPSGRKVAAEHLRAVLSRLEDVGGEINAYTTKEETCIYTSFMKEDYSRALELLKDINWDGVLSIECEAAPGKIEQSIEWLRKEISR